MSEPARQRFSFRDYVELEEMSRVKHEFLAGHVWAMAGGSPDHAAVAANVIALLHGRLAGRPCSVFSSDLRIRVAATGLGTYPDVSIVCGSLELDAEDPKRHTVLNPRVLVEVLSPSTEDYDRGEKVAHYRSIPSLEEILLVAHEERHIDVWRRTSAGWEFATARGAGPVMLESLDCELTLEEVYGESPLASR